MNRIRTRSCAVSAALLGVALLASCGSSGSKPGAATTTSATPTSRPRASTTTAAASAATTTTTAAGSSPGTAESASFVSASDGFVLEDDGTVASTVDGGHTWRRAGMLAAHGPDETIRFIGPSDGFAFARNSGALVITHDGGATWSAVARTPFSTVADLAVARGTVYVVALASGGAPAFRIWSAPVEHLEWRLDPRSLPVGAGPVPVEQIVLAGGHGWILDQNRTVLAGARLGANGAWSAWTPPCTKVFGPAFLTASTGSDLAAACDEGVWGGNLPKITPSVWFSHDGGTTFARHVAPAFGPALSPNPASVVLLGEARLERTTDGGATWQDGAQVPGGGSTDAGFTTSTQGFVIRGGEMLMTRDAGATWNAVTLP